MQTGPVQAGGPAAPAKPVGTLDGYLTTTCHSGPHVRGCHGTERTPMTDGNTINVTHQCAYRDRDSTSIFGSANRYGDFLKERPGGLTCPGGIKGATAGLCIPGFETKRYQTNLDTWTQALVPNMGTGEIHNPQGGGAVVNSSSFSEAAGLQPAPKVNRTLRQTLERPRGLNRHRPVPTRSIPYSRAKSATHPILHNSVCTRAKNGKSSKVFRSPLPKGLGKKQTNLASWLSSGRGGPHRKGGSSQVSSSVDIPPVPVPTMGLSNRSRQKKQVSRCNKKMHPSLTPSQRVGRGSENLISFEHINVNGINPHDDFIE